MEVPASIYALRVPTPTGSRRLNATELAVAGLVYAHARHDGSPPYCSIPIETAAAMVGHRLNKVRDASRVLTRAGFWSRAQVGSCVWRWEVLILPSTPGHRWADVRPLGDIVRTPDRGLPGSGQPTPDLGTPQSGEPSPDSGYVGTPDQGYQDPEQIQAAEAASLCVLRAVPLAPTPLQRAAAIDASSERYEVSRRTYPPPRFGEGTRDTSADHAALRARFHGLLAMWSPGTPERTRLAACTLASPVEAVLRAACEELGGLVSVGDVLEWAWAEVAQGRLPDIGRAAASQALREAFRGEGRYWRGILDAYGKAQPRQQRLDEWRPPDLGDHEPATQDEFATPWSPTG